MNLTLATFPCLCREDRIHQMLAARIKHIHDLFGQIPDTLGAAWIAAAQGDERKAHETIDAVPEKHPWEKWEKWGQNGVSVQILKIFLAHCAKLNDTGGPAKKELR